MFQSRFGLIIFIAILVLLNVAAMFGHFRIDLTEEKRYTLSEATRSLVSNMEGEVQIDVFLQGNLPAGFRKLAQSTSEFLGTLKEENTDAIQYRFIAPEDEMEGTGKSWGDTLVGLGARPINLTVQIESGQQQQYIFPVALVRSGGRQELINLYSGPRNISQVEINQSEAMLEYRFAKAFDDLKKEGLPLVAYSFGNGEPTDLRTASLVQTLGENYQPFMLNLNTEPFIDDTFSVVMIVKPAQEFTEDEKIKIDQYLMRGGRLLMFIDGLYAEQDSLRFKTETIAYDRNLNIDDLLFRYGARINPDLVMDLQCDFLPFAVGGDAEQPQYEFLKWNYYPLFESPGNHLINKNLGLVAGRYVNSIDTIAVAGVRKTILLSSSSSSRTIVTPALISLNENRNLPEDAAFNKDDIPVAVLLEGSFPSLYRNRLSRVWTDSLQSMNRPFSGQSEQARIILAADGDMVLNDVSASQGPLPMGLNLFTLGTQYEYQFANRDFLLNCLEYLTGKPEIIEVRNKDIILRLLDASKIREQQSAWQFINVALPVLLVILAGVLYQFLRRRKYA